MKYDIFIYFNQTFLKGPDFNPITSAHYPVNAICTYNLTAGLKYLILLI